MALQDYSQLKGFYNDAPITQVTSLEIVTEAGNQRVELLEGLGGDSGAWSAGFASSPLLVVHQQAARVCRVLGARACATCVACCFVVCSLSL